MRAWNRVGLRFRKIFHKDYLRRSVEVNNVKIRVGHWPGGSPKVFCVHGLTANHLCFDSLARGFQSHGHSVYALDLRGRGQSDRPSGPYSIQTHVEDIRAVLDELAIKPVLIGHSLGAFISIQLATKYPDYFKGLVLIDGGGAMSVLQKLRALQAIKPSLKRLGQTFESDQEYFHLARTSPLFSDWNKTIERFLAYELSPDQHGVKQNIESEHIEAELQSMGGSLKNLKIATGMISHPLQAFKKIKFMNTFPYEKIRCPTLILRAGRSNVEPGDHVLPMNSLHEMLRRIPNAKGYTIQSANHFEIILGEHRERDELLNRFVDSIPK